MFKGLESIWLACYYNPVTFIDITHNPITMARMDRLFGVTMGEHGVSQLVSVDLRTAQSLRDV